MEDWIKASSRYAPMGPSRRAELLELLESRRGDMHHADYLNAKGAIERH